jgi:seryl-tRNA(Sec) selenium transferase
MAADHFVTTVHTHHGESILQDRSVAEVRDEPVELANATIEASERWARADGREVRFRATWQAGDRVLASHQWTSGEGDPTALDGTVDSFLAQQQRHQEADHRLHHDGFAMVQDGWKSLLKLAQTQIETLSKENAELRERLRKSGDVDNEIAMAHAASELEGRARTAELIESRILPLVQHMAMKYLETGATNLNGGSPASTADPAPAA